MIGLGDEVKVMYDGQVLGTGKVESMEVVDGRAVRKVFVCWYLPIEVRKTVFYGLSCPETWLVAD